MSSARPMRGARWLAFALVLVFLTATASACDSIPGMNGGSDNGAEVVATPQADHGACLPTYADDVRSLSMNRDGSRLLYISGARPEGLGDDATWRSGDRAVHVMSFDPQGAASTRLLVLPWPPGEDAMIPVWPTEDAADASPPEPFVFAEQMDAVDIAGEGDRFVLGVSRRGVGGGLAKLYAGVVSDSEESLEPGSGLTLVRVNDFVGTESVRSVSLSPDGSKLAAVVGTQGELRVFDFSADQLYVYTQGEEGEIEVTHDLPPAATTITQSRVPALAHAGVLRVRWAPDNQRIAISRYESVGVAGVWILDYATGDAALVRTFNNTTVPHVAWSGDGQSLFTMTTQLFQANLFGDSEVRRIEAAEDGDDMGDRWQLIQKPGYRTAPADLLAYGDDRNFLFTWEQQLWLLQVPATGSGNAMYGPVTLSAPDMRVASGTVSVAPPVDRAAFLVTDAAGSHVGLRLDVTQETCDAQGGAPADEAAEEQPVEEGAQETAATPTTG